MITEQPKIKAAAALQRQISRNLRLEMARKEPKMTMHRLGIESGLSQGTISGAANGTKMPSLESLSAIAMALDIEPWELLFNQEDDLK